MVEFRLLGPPQILWDGRPVPILRRAGRALLFYLVAKAEPVARDELTTLLWPDAPADAAPRRLRITAYRLRDALARAGVHSGLITTTGGAVGLEAGLWRSDLRVFEAGLQALAGSTWPAAAIVQAEAALALCRGEFVAGFSLPDSPAFEDWLRDERERLADLAIRARITLARQHSAARRFSQAQALLLQVLAVDPLHEEAHRHIVECRLELGDEAGARRHYEQLRASLAREVRREPEPATRALLERAIRVTAGVPAAAAASLAPGRAEPPGEIPFAGRAAQLAELKARWQDAITGRGQAVLVTGPEGQGKSRLVRELALAIGPHAMLLAGVCSRAGADLPYQVLAELLRPGLEELARRRPSRPMDKRAAEIQQWRGDLLRLLSPASAGLRASLDPQGEQNLWEAIAQHLGELASERPLMLVLDDVHWADGHTLELLVHLTHRLATSAFMWIATLRSDQPEKLIGFQADLVREPNAALLALPPLAADEVAELLGALPGGEAAGALAPRLMALTEGNPFFLAETLRALLAAGALSGAPGPDGAGLALPPTARVALVRRLVGLSPLAREAAGVLAVLGLRAATGVLERMAAGSLGARRGEALADALDELVQARILEEDPGGYRFAHGQFREAVLDQMGSARRRGLHRRAVAALEREAPGGEMDAEILYHAEQAGEWAAALAAARRAAATAAGRYGYAEAAALLTRALAALDRLPDDPAVRQELLLAREDALHVLGRRAEQQEDLAELIKLAGPQIDYRAGRYHHTMGDWMEAEASLRRAIEGAGAEAETGWAIDAHRLLALSIAHMGRADESAPAALDAVARSGSAAARLASALALAELAEAREQPPELAHWVAEAQPLAGPDAPPAQRLSWLLLASRSAHFDRRHQEAVELASEAQALAASLGALDAEARAWLGIANAASRLARFDEAAGAYEQAIERYRLLGQRASVARVHASLGLMLIRRWKLPEAREHCQAAYDEFGALGDALDRCGAGMHLGTCLARMGLPAEAERVLRDTIALAGELGLRDREVQALQSLGAALVTLHRPGEARPALERSIDLGEGRPESLVTNTWLAMACLGLGDLDEADRVSAIAVEDVARVDPPLIAPQLVHFARALVLRAGGDQAGAQAALAEAIAARDAALARQADDAARAAYLANYPVNALIAAAERGEWPDPPRIA